MSSYLYEDRLILTYVNWCRCSQVMILGSCRAWWNGYGGFTHDTMWMTLNSVQRDELMQTYLVIGWWPILYRTFTGCWYSHKTTAQGNFWISETKAGSSWCFILLLKFVYSTEKLVYAGYGRAICVYTQVTEKEVACMLDACCRKYIRVHTQFHAGENAYMKFWTTRAISGVLNSNGYVRILQAQFQAAQQAQVQGEQLKSLIKHCWHSDVLVVGFRRRSSGRNPSCWSNKMFIRCCWCLS